MRKTIIFYFVFLLHIVACKPVLYISSSPLECEVVFMGESQILNVDRLERPQHLTDHNGIPTVMYVASSVGKINPKNDGSSFNEQISLTNKKNE